jgi:hypothetical protein
VNDEQRNAWREIVNQLQDEPRTYSLNVASDKRRDAIIALDAYLVELEANRYRAARLAGLVLVQLNTRAPVSLAPDRHAEMAALAQKLAAPAVFGVIGGTGTIAGITIKADPGTIYEAEQGPDGHLRDWKPQADEKN